MWLCRSVYLGAVAVGQLLVRGFVDGFPIWTLLLLKLLRSVCLSWQRDFSFAAPPEVSPFFVLILVALFSLSESKRTEDIMYSTDCTNFMAVLPAVT